MGLAHYHINCDLNLFHRWFISHVQRREKEKQKLAAMMEEQVKELEAKAHRRKAFQAEKSKALKVLAGGRFHTTREGQLLFDGPASVSRRKRSWVTTRLAEAEALRKQAKFNKEPNA